jgi:hypothetical protein
MSDSRETSAFLEATTTTQNPPRDSEEPEESRGDGGAEQRRTEVERNRREEGREDRYPAGREKDSNGPVSKGAVFPEMFFG